MGVTKSAVFTPLAFGSLQAFVFYIASSKPDLKASAELGLYTALGTLAGIGVIEFLNKADRYWH